MVNHSSPPRSCYVFDTSSLIRLERWRGLQCLPEYPGRWLVVPNKVGKQLDGERAPKETRKWLESGKWASFSVDSENRLYMKLRAQYPLLEDPDIQGIVIAHHRKGTYVVEEKLATTIADGLGVRTLKLEGFLSEVVPQFQIEGFGYKA